MRPRPELAAAIERALLHPAPANVQRVLALARHEDAARTADRVQLRAKRLAAAPAQRARVLAAADALVLRLYHAVAPSGWLCAWCDASVTGGSAAVGALLLDRNARELARIAEPVAACAPFEAEIAALEAVLRALPRSAARVRVHTDCDALVALWLQRRRDARLGAVRALARRLRRFELRAVPRRHNRSAHRLARAAAAAAS